MPLLFGTSVTVTRENLQEVTSHSFINELRSRGFFHINSHGGAEPSPFSPYSDINVKDTSLREALKSRLFTTLRSGEMLTGEHSGGCVLFEQREGVEAILKEEPVNA